LLLKQSSDQWRDWLEKLLSGRYFELSVVDCSAELESYLATAQVDVVLLDISTPSLENRKAFDLVKELESAPPIVVFGSEPDRSLLIKFIKHGAAALFSSADEPDVITHTIRQAADSGQLRRDNVLLRDELALKEKAVGVLERLGEAMSAVFDVSKIFNLTLKVVRRALDCEVCYLFLLEDGEEGRLVDVRDLGYADGHPQLELWERNGTARRPMLLTAARKTLATGQALTLEDQAEIMALIGCEPDASDGSVTSLVTAPLASGESNIGVFVAANRIGAAGFTAEDQDILLSIARQTGMALSGIRSRQKEQTFQEKLAGQVEIATGKLQERNMELKRRLDEKEAANRKIRSMADEIAQKNRSLEEMIKQFSVIHEISQVIGSELENETLIKRIIGETSTLLNAETVSIMLKNGDGCLRIKHAEGLSPEIIKDTAVKPGEGISGWVAEEGKPMLVKDADRFRTGSPDRTTYHSDSLLCVPLKIKGQVTGVLNVTNREGGTSFDERDLFLLTILGNHAAVAIENSRLYTAIQDSYFKTIKALVNAVEAKDTWTKDHSENVTNYSLKIADFLGLSKRQKDIIRYAGVLHDIGKIVISSTITDKADKLTEDEWERMREHPLIGQRILDPIDYLEPVKVCIQTHHERCDGSGYPFGLRAHEIPLETRIISVADAFDAMIHSRPYRAALTVQDAVDELRRSSGSQFDPAVVEGLVTILEAEGSEGMLEH
jgi:HD-GYP domain-containing protein (c-di-GMP phosphodiesterase class II)/DNA-binding response OmpR family regulator